MKMNKKMRWQGVLALLLCAGLLAGCGSTGETVDAEEDYVVELYADTEDTEKESVAEPDEDTEAVAEPLELPSEETVSEMLGSFLNWSALCYMRGGDMVQQDGLTPNQTIPMAAHAASASDVRITTDDSIGCYVVAPEVWKKYEENLFGQSSEPEEYTLAEDGQGTVDDRGINLQDCVGVAEDGTVYVAMGDWGESTPVFQVQEITQIDETEQILVKVNYYKQYISQEADSEEYKLCMLAEYTMEPSADSTYGYIITDMTYAAPESDAE